MMDRTKLKVYGALLGVFLLGSIGGGAVGSALTQRRMRGIFKDPSAVFEKRRVGALSRRLDLDDAQEDKVRSVVNKYGSKRRELTRDIMERCGAPLREQKAQMDTEIRGLLRADQQERYDRLLKDGNRRHPPGEPLDP
jgi:hypothetical protein